MFRLADITNDKLMTIHHCMVSSVGICNWFCWMVFLKDDWETTKQNIKDECCENYGFIKLVITILFVLCYIFLIFVTFFSDTLEW